MRSVHRIRCVRPTNISVRLIQHSRSVFTKFIHSLQATYTLSIPVILSELTLVITLNSHGPETEPSPSHHAIHINFLRLIYISLHILA